MTRMALRVVGPFRGTSGYDRLTREFVRQFVKSGVLVQLLELCGWSYAMPENLRDRHFDELAGAIDARTTLHIALPTQVHAHPETVNVNYTMFEASRIPASWAAASARSKLVIVPTDSSLAAWLAAGVPSSKLRIAPQGVDVTYFGASVTPLNLLVGNRRLSSYGTRVLSVADLTPRKNHLGLLRSWIRATEPGDDAVLVIKSTASRQRCDEFLADVAQMEAELGRGLRSAAPVALVFELFSDDTMRALYQASTHYISMSLGEGWDLPMMEAAVSGCQLIAPRHSSYLSYLTDDDAELLPVREVPAMFEGRLRPEDAIWFEGTTWWRPDESAASELLRAIVRGTYGAPKASPKRRISTAYPWQRAAQRVLEILREAT